MPSERPSEDRLAEIRSWEAQTSVWIQLGGHVEEFPSQRSPAADDIVEARLIVSQLLAEVDVLRPIVEAMANMPSASTRSDGAPATCPWCEQEYGYTQPTIEHSANCPVKKAQEALGL
jgi:hypothetical protein